MLIYLSNPSIRNVIEMEYYWFGVEIMDVFGDSLFILEMFPAGKGFAVKAKQQNSFHLWKKQVCKWFYMRRTNLLLLESRAFWKELSLTQLSQLSAASFTLKPDKMVQFAGFKLYRLSEGKLDREMCWPLSEELDGNCHLVQIRLEMCMPDHENLSPDTPELPSPAVTSNTQYISLSVQDLPLH